MITIFKKSLIKICTRMNREKWAKRDSTKVLIQTSRYFNKLLWKSVIEKSEFSASQDIEVKYTSSKISFINLFSDSDICFCFRLSNYIQIDNAKPKLLYFASVGTEFLSGKNLPDNFTIITPAGISSQAIAEYVVAMVLQMNRNLHFSIRNQVFRRWRQQEIISHPFIAIRNKIIGILGFGRNGLSIANMFTNLGCRVLVCDIDKSKNDKRFEFYSFEDLDTFLSQVDVLVLALPLNENTEGLIDPERLKMFKPGCIIVNISRGAIIDERALIKLVKKGVIKGAILDVFEKEPLSRIHKFWSLKNIIVTPHIAGNINIFRNEIMKDFVENLKSRL